MAKILGIRKIGVLLAAVGAGVAAPYAKAEESALYFEGVPTVYSASRMPQAQSETPGFVTVIDREMIRATGAREVSELLRLVPGFQVTSRNLEIAARVTYHGLSSEDYSPRLQVLVDGRSQYSALFNGGVNWDLLPVAIENIERIEVVRGSNVAAYGTNAFLGVVNIITTDPAQTRGTTVSTTMGTRGVSDQFVRFGGAVGEANLRISYQGLADDGIRFVPQESKDTRSIANGQQKQLFDLRADMPVGMADTLSVNVGKIEGRMKIGRSDALDTDPFTQTQKMTNPPRSVRQSSQYAQLGWQRSLEGGDELQVRLHSTEDRLDDPPIFASNVFPLDQSGRSTRDELELQHLVNLTPATRMLWGMGTRQEKVDQSFQYYAGGGSRKVQRIFSNVEWRPWQPLTLNVGGSFDKDSMAGEHFSPRAAASYQVAEGHTLRAGVTQAYRLPSFIETIGYVNYVPVGWPMGMKEYVADGRIQAEKLISRELGYYGDFQEWRASLDVRAFHEHIPNRIRAVPAAPASSTYDYPVNAEDVEVTGFEYQLRLNPWEGTRLMFGQSAVQVDTRLLDFATRTSTPILQRVLRQTRNSAPQLTNSAMLMQQLPNNLNLSVMVYQTDTMYWTPNKPAGAYTRVDWRLARPFSWGSTRGEVAYVVQSEEGAHPELKASNLVLPRQWVSVRLDF